MRTRWLVVAGAALALLSTARAGEDVQEVCIRAGSNGMVRDVAIAPIPNDRPQPDANYEGFSELEVHGFPEVRGVLMRWEVPQSPVVSSATAVKIRLHVTKQSKSTYEVYPLLRPWTPAQATWLSPMEGQLWGAPGASSAELDFDPTPLGRFAATDDVVDIDLDGGASLLTQWSGSTTMNFGIVIRNQQTAVPNQIGLDSARFYSAEAAEVGLRPALIVSSQSDEVILQEGDGGYEGEVDTTISSSAPPNLNGRSLAVEGATFGSNEAAEPVVSLLWFDLSSIPALARVVGGGLELCSPAEATGRVVVDGLSRPWNDREATWATSGALEVGSDRRGIVAAEIDVDGGCKALSLTDAGIALVQEWVWDPRVNHGFILGSDTGGTAVIFRGSETWFDTQRPMLCVHYAMDRSLDLHACGCSAGGGIAAVAFALPLLLRALRRRRA
jgi:hypothetical protein